MRPRAASTTQQPGRTRHKRKAGGRRWNSQPVTLGLLVKKASRVPRCEVGNKSGGFPRVFPSYPSPSNFVYITEDLFSKNRRHGAGEQRGPHHGGYDGVQQDHQLE